MRPPSPFAHRAARAPDPRPLRDPDLGYGRASAALVWAAIGVACQPPADEPPPASGLSAHYFEDDALSTEVRRQIDATIDFDWGERAPAQMLPADGFSVRWQGELTARASETHRFHLVSAGRARLYVNGFLLIDHWDEHAVSDDEGVIPLIAGRQYPLVVEYANTIGSASIRLDWQAQTRAREVVPEDAFWPEPRGTGLAAEYFDESDFTSLKDRRVDGQVWFAWGGELASGTLALDAWSGRWSGHVRAPATGETTFHLAADGAARLVIGGAEVVNLPDGGEGSGSVALDADALTPISVQLSRAVPGGSIALEWETPAGTREVVPSQRLHPRGFPRGPVWKMVALVVRHTKVQFTDPKTGTPVQLDTTITPAEEAGAIEALRTLPQLVRDWSDGNGAASLDVVIVDDLPVPSVTAIGESYWVGSSDAEAILDKYAPPGTYDSIFLVWDPDGDTSQVPICCWYGQGRSRGTNDATYASIPILSDGAWNGPYPGEVLIHEWEHGSTAYYRAERGVAVPDPHDNAIYGHPQSDSRRSWWQWYVAEVSGMLVDPTTGEYAGFTPSVWALGTPTQPVGAVLVPPPGNVRITSANATGVTLGWDVAPGGDHYRIFRGTAPGVEHYLGWTLQTTYVDTTATPGQPWYYVLRTVSDQGIESRDSTEVSATP